MVAEINVVVLVLYGLAAAYGTVLFVKIRNERDDLKKKNEELALKIIDIRADNYKMLDLCKEKSTELHELKIEATKLADLSGKLMEQYKALQNQNKRSLN